MSGRPSMPAAFAEKYGNKNWTKAELEEKRRTEIVMDSDEIRPSASLPNELHDRFYWFVAEFEEYGILSNVDSDSLSRYIMADYQYWRITKEIEQLSPSSDGYTSLTMAQNRFFNQTQTLAKELGLTMVSRTKLKREEKEEKEEKSKEEQLFGSKL